MQRSLSATFVLCTLLFSVVLCDVNCTTLDIDDCLESTEAADCAWCDAATDDTYDHRNGTCVFFDGECGSLLNGHQNDFDHTAQCPGGHLTRSEYNVCRDAVYAAKYCLFLGSLLCAAFGILMWLFSMLVLKFRRPRGPELTKWIRLFTWRVHVYMMFVSFVWTFCLLLIGFLIAGALDLTGSTPAVLLGTFAAYVVTKEFSHVIYTILGHVEKGRLNVDGLAMNASAACYFVISIYFAIAYQPFVYNEDEEIRLVALLDSIIVMFSFICRELLTDGVITYAKNYIKSTTDVVSGAPSRALQAQIDQIQSKPERSATLDDFDDPAAAGHHGHEEVEDDTWPHATPTKKKLNQFVRVLDFGFMIAIIVELGLVFTNQPEHILDTERVIASARRAYILAFLSLARTWLVETQHTYGEQRWLAGKKFQFHYTEVHGDAAGQGRSVLLEVGNKNDQQVWSQLSEQLIPDNEKHG